MNMGKYFALQLKRVARFLPLSLCVMVILFGCLGILYQALVSQQADESQTQTTKIKVGMVGTAGDRYLQWGMAAMQFDSTAMSIEMVQLKEAEAVAALENGEIAAFVAFPENFVEEALYGNVQQLRFVSTVGATGLVSIIKEEVTRIVDRILVACERGSYGVGEALTDQDLDHLWGKHVNDLALEYVDFLFDRSKIYRVESLVQEDFVPFEQYMLGGLTVLLLMLGCLPFAPLYVRSDLSLSRLLRSKGVGVIHQVAAELGAYFLALAVLLAGVSAVIGWAGMLPQTSAWNFFLQALPTLAMVAALSYLLFSLAANLMGGVLLTFFVVLALGFAGGCMYPVQVFPETMQRLAAMLPSGLARMSLIEAMGGSGPICGGLLLYAVGFVLMALGVRAYKTGKVRG